MEGTVCLIIREDKILMKLAVRGISKGRWNFPGGKIDAGETPEGRRATGRSWRRQASQYPRRNIMASCFSHSREGRSETGTSTYSQQRSSAGELKESDEGPLKWFDADALPAEFMWSGDRIWFPHVLAGRKIAAASLTIGKGKSC